MPDPILAAELLRRLQERGGMDDLAMGAAPVAPDSAYPPEFYSDVPNAGLGLAPMASDVMPAQNPAAVIAAALAQQKAQRK